MGTIRMKLDLTPEDQLLLTVAIDQSLASARRQQKTSKQPQIRQVYEAQERALVLLQGKIAAAK